MNDIRKLASCSETLHLLPGQEDATLDFDEGIKITPFNMRDEMEEGHFDSEGTFIFNKEVMQIYPEHRFGGWLGIPLTFVSII